MEEYQNLKEKLSSSISSSDLEILKNCFAEEIASKRTLNDVRSVDDLLSILEIRDCLSASNVACLDNIGTLLGKNEISNLVHTYKKLYASDDSKCLCSIPENLLNQNLTFENTVVHTVLDEAQNSELDDAIKSISSRIGENWAVLVRELHLTEREIMNVRENFRNDFETQSTEALHIWKSHAGPKATVSALTNALNQRHCRRKGLGSHMIYSNFVK